MLVYSTALPGRELGKRLVLGQSLKSQRGISTAPAAERLSAGRTLCLAFCPSCSVAVCKAFSRERGSPRWRRIRAPRTG